MPDRIFHARKVPSYGATLHALQRERRAAKEIRARDPRLADELVEMSAEALRECAPNRVVLAEAAGISPSRGSRWLNGDPHSSAYRALELTYGLTLHPRGSAAPLLSRLHAAVERVSVQEEETHALVERWWELSEDTRGTRPEQLLNLATTAEMDERAAGRATERAAISRELLRRRVNPVAYRLGA